MSNTKKVAVIIPIYKPDLSPLEQIALNRCFDVLSAYDIIAIKPESLKLNEYGCTFSKVVSFEDTYFSDIQGYNRLMLSASFYQAFLDYTYILIHQLDAFTFKDELLTWCNKGYDYIGAPWLRYAAYPDLFKKLKNQTRHYLHLKMNIKQSGTDFPTKWQFENKVGNGGFSLRKTEKFHEICTREQKTIDYYNSRNEHFFNEDVFWGLEVNRRRKQLAIPDYREAVYFAIENSNQHGLELTKSSLPFGCHAWDRDLDFWRPLFSQVGVII